MSVVKLIFKNNETATDSHHIRSSNGVTYKEQCRPLTRSVVTIQRQMIPSVQWLY